ADDLDRIGESAITSYLDKAGDKLIEEDLREMLDAETWLSADEAYQYGLCDIVEESNEMVACLDDKFMEHYQNIPSTLQKTTMSREEMELREKIAQEAKASSEITKTILGGIYS